MTRQSWQNTSLVNIIHKKKHTHTHTLTKIQETLCLRRSYLLFPFNHHTYFWTYNMREKSIHILDRERINYALKCFNNLIHLSNFLFAYTLTMLTFIQNTHIAHLKLTHPLSLFSLSLVTHDTHTHWHWKKVPSYIF